MPSGTVTSIQLSNMRACTYIWFMDSPFLPSPCSQTFAHKDQRSTLFASDSHVFFRLSSSLMIAFSFLMLCLHLLFLSLIQLLFILSESPQTSGYSSGTRKYLTFHMQYMTHQTLRETTSPYSMWERSCSPQSLFLP
jgi:hypothetical protein